MQRIFVSKDTMIRNLKCVASASNKVQCCYQKTQSNLKSGKYRLRDKVSQQLDPVNKVDATFKLTSKKIFY